jgi:hypothetical protein
VAPPSTTSKYAGRRSRTPSSGSAVVGIDQQRRASVALLLEIVTNIRRDESLGPGHAVERKPQAFAYRAARAVGADQPIGAKLACSLGRLRGDRHARSILLQCGHSIPEMHGGLGQAPQVSQNDLGQPVLAEV